MFLSVLLCFSLDTSLRPLHTLVLDESMNRIRAMLIPCPETFIQEHSSIPCEIRVVVMVLELDGRCDFPKNKQYNSIFLKGLPFRYCLNK